MREDWSEKKLRVTEAVWVHRSGGGGRRREYAMMIERKDKHRGSITSVVFMKSDAAGSNSKISTKHSKKRNRIKVVLKSG